MELDTNEHSLTGRVCVRLVVLDDELPPPSYAHPYDAGMDLYARTAATLAPFERALVPTGVSIELPPGFAGFIHPRSGLALRQGLTVVNSPGTIDAGYRGEIQVALVNVDREATVDICRGDRVAQLVVQPVSTVVWDVVNNLTASQRRDGGFGSTGLAGLPG